MTALKLIGITIAFLVVSLGIPSLTVAALWGATIAFGLAAAAFVLALFGQAR